MSTPQWYFQPVSPNDRVRGSQVEKFFKSDVLEKRPTAVVREGIQNSLDAIAGGYSDVLVRIGLGRAPAHAVRPYIPGLFPHLAADAVRAKLPQLPTTAEDVCYLTFEDFHTTGLEGDPAQWEPLDDVKNPFFNFFRGEGVTDKSGNARGRHGVGKLVFSALGSRAGCMFGLTLTDRGPPLLMGTSTLVPHRVDRSYHPDGWFGVGRQIEGNGTLQVPVEDGGFIRDFTSTFGLQRGDAPGLSIVVPWIDPQEFSHHAVLRAIVGDFFWPILRKELIVDLESEQGLVTINAKSLRTVLESLDADSRRELEPRISLAEWALSAGSAPSVITHPPEKTPHWTAASLSPEGITSIRQSCESGQPLSIQVPMRISPKQGPQQDTNFHIYLQPDAASPDGKVFFVREGLIISAVRPKRCQRVHALVVIDEGPLAKFLGDAENPAHTEWLKENVRGGYQSWVACLEYVINCVPSLLRLVSEQQKEADPTLLLDLFALPTQQVAPKKPLSGPKKKGGGDSGDGMPVLPPPPPKRFSLARRASGFVIRKGDPHAELPARIDIQLGYGVRRGSPFKKWRTADFDLADGELVIEAEGCRYETPAGNRLQVTIDNPEFSLAVTGFDTNRDLHIDPRVKTREELDGPTT